MHLQCNTSTPPRSAALSVAPQAQVSAPGRSGADAMVDELSESTQTALATPQGRVDFNSMVDRASETTVTMATPFEEFIIPDFTDILVISDLVLLG